MTTPLDQFMNIANAPIAQAPNSSLPINFDQNTYYPLGKMNYSNLSRASRAYTAVLSPNREQGAFNDSQEAINYVHSLKGGNILVLPGTYTFNTKNITMYSSIQMVGIDPNLCIFDFGSTPYHFVSSGNYINRFSNLTFQNCTAEDTGPITFINSFFIDVNYCFFTNNTTGAADSIVPCISAVSSGKLHINNNHSNYSNYFFSSDIPYDISEVNGNYIYNCDKAAFYGFGTDGGGNGGGQTHYHSNWVDSTCGTAFYGQFTYAQISDNTLLSNMYIKDSFFSSINNNFVSDSDTGKNAIAFVSSYENTITGNILAGGTAGTTYGISFDANSGTNILIGNRLRGNTAGYLDNGVGNVVSPNV